MATVNHHSIVNTIYRPSSQRKRQRVNHDHETEVQLMKRILRRKSHATYLMILNRSLTMCCRRHRQQWIDRTINTTQIRDRLNSKLCHITKLSKLWIRVIWQTNWMSCHWLEILCRVLEPKSRQPYVQTNWWSSSCKKSFPKFSFVFLLDKNFHLWDSRWYSSVDEQAFQVSEWHVQYEQHDHICWTWRTTAS